MNQTKLSMSQFEIKVANSFKERLLGLTIYQIPQKDFAFVIPNCKLVHTFGMHFSLDLLFVDRNGAIIELFETVKPGSIKGAFHAAHTIELNAGSIQQHQISKGNLICKQSIPF